DCIKLVMDVDGEVKEAARNENSRQFAHDLARRFGVIDDVIAEHDIKASIRKRQRLTNRRYGLRVTLPARKQVSITNCQGIDADSAFRSKIEDEAVCSTANLNNTSIGFDRLKRLEFLAHAARRPHHRGNNLLFTPANMLRLVLLIGELALER